MDNKFNSALYLYVKLQVKYLGVKNIGKSNIQKAYDAIDLLITKCCVLGFPNTKSPFLNNVYKLLSMMEMPQDMRKLKEVRRLLQPYVESKCC